MIRNYLLTAFRFMLRQKTYSFINIFGLAVGLASCLLIVMYITDELSYDRYLKDSDKIFRVGVHEKFQGQDNIYVTAGYPLAEAIRTEIPEVTGTLQFRRYNNFPIKNEEKTFIENKMVAADSGFFRFFSFNILEGNARTCLKGPNKLAISEAAAKKYFGYTGQGAPSPLGRMLVVGNQGNITAEVSAIFQDMPANTHLKFDVIMSMETLSNVWDAHVWSNYGVYTYFKINDASNIASVEKKLDHFIGRDLRPETEKVYHVVLQKFRTGGDDIRFVVQPLTSIHLESHFTGELEANGEMRYILIFGGVAIMIILIACINFMNLSTARASHRAKEVGVRKTVGAVRGGLVFQFMAESMLCTILSAILAFGIVLASFRGFNTLAGKDLSLNMLINPWFAAGVVIVIIVIGLLSGSYPAIYLTSFRPASILKGSVMQGGRSRLRNGLVIFQFAISMALIISTLMIYEQIQYIQEQSLGFQSENVLRISNAGALGNLKTSFKNEVLAYPDYTSVSFASQLPPDITWEVFAKPDGSDQLINCHTLAVDPENLKAMGYAMKSGRFFSRDFPADSDAVVINETLAKKIGYENFENKNLTVDQGLGPGHTKLRVIGIIADFNFLNLRRQITPAIITRTESGNTMAVRLTAGHVGDKVQLIESVWKKYAPGTPFQYAFMDEVFDSTFRAEQKMQGIFLVFTCLAIFIACLGLFGLITFMAEQRVKELGIRKVLGASVAQLMFLLSKDLMQLVVIAFIIAIPMVWVGINQWLEGFPYRIAFDFLAVFAAGVVGSTAALLTISYQSFRAAAANPVKSLKNE